MHIQLEYCARIHCIRIWGARIQGGLYIFRCTEHIGLEEFEGPWNRIAKFLSYSLYVRFAIPLCVSFFCGVIPYMVLWDEVGFCRKIIFPAHFFLAHAWTASNPHKINMWVDLGTWNIVFFNNLKKTEALPKINLSSSEKLFFFRACLEIRL